MNYSNIQPPFTLKFMEMSKQELLDYYRWYMDILLDRIAILAEAVRTTPGYEQWIPDMSPDSLVVLGNWFAAHVETRELTQEEIDAITRKLAFPIDIDKHDLSIRTLSLTYDIGMYLSQVFLREHPTLQWHQDLKRKTFLNYGQPVLVWFGRVDFNPTRMVRVLANGLTDGTYSGSTLRELYDIWSAKIA